MTHRRAPDATSALDAPAATELAAQFKALGDPIRLRLMSMITSADGGEICVCDLTPTFDVSGPTISHHDGDRRGTWVYYQPVKANLSRLAALLETPDIVGG